MFDLPTLIAMLHVYQGFAKLVFQQGHKYDAGWYENAIYENWIKTILSTFYYSQTLNIYCRILIMDEGVKHTINSIGECDPNVNLNRIKAVIAEKITASPRRKLPLNGNKPAAVLIPLFERAGAPFLLFTRRSQLVRHHKGQISFPGGQHDRADTDLEMTARRETEEEIGVATTKIEIIGALDDYVTNTAFRVTPYVGTIPYPYPFQINRAEIDELIEIPLAHLLDPYCHHTEIRDIPNFNPPRVTIHFFTYENHVVWGVTGHILFHFLQQLCQHLS